MAASPDADRIRRLVGEVRPLDSGPSVVGIDARVFRGRLDPVSPLRAGQRVGRCVVQALVRRGPRGPTYRAFHDGLRRTVGVKVLDVSVAPGSEAMARFEREARAAGRVRHPHVAALLEAGRDAATGVSYIVTEYVDGETLADVVARSGPLDARRLRDVAVETLDGLVAIHAQGTLHRDLRPARLMITESGFVKIADLGMSRHIEDEPITRPGRLVGSVDYMAPEVGADLRLDARADLYSLACVLYFAAVGEPPFAAPTARAALARKLREPFPAIRARATAVPRALDALTRRLGARERERRFSSADDAREAFEDLDLAQ